VETVKATMLYRKINAVHVNFTEQGRVGTVLLSTPQSSLQEKIRLLTKCSGVDKTAFCYCDKFNEIL